MLFSSVVFLFLFLPVVCVIYAIVPQKLKNAVLIIASLLFYAYGEPKAVVLMIISVIVNYILALCVEKNKNKIVFVLSVIFNVGMLVVFKYLNFFTDCINAVFNTDIYLAEIHLPIGISFFTFQAMSYVADVYRGDVRAQKSFAKLLLYISFFPQLIAGPIIKYHDIESRLDKRKVSIDDVSEGLKLFIYGLSSKLLIANTMGSVADTVFGYENNELYPLLSWIGAVCYTMQIYFDFSGYSNMAIGLGRIFGFNFAPNFNLPFISKGIKEFWRRWHISLSTWFKEYVYIPLGGNRKGKAMTAVNQIIVFTLTGLWHGANMTFVVWGLVHGIIVVIESFFNKLFAKVPSFLMHIYTMFVVILAFVIFRADSIGYGLKYIVSMFVQSENCNFSTAAELCNPYNITMFVIAVFMSFGLHKKTGMLAEKFLNEKVFTILKYVFSLVLFLLCIINISAATYNPFIYFRF